MKALHFHLKHEWRHALQGAIAIGAAVSLGNYIDSTNVVWNVLGALVVIQTSRGTPARQGLYTLFASLCAVIIGFFISQYLMQRELFFAVMTLILFASSLFMMLRQPENYQLMLQWLLPPLILVAAVMWPTESEMLLANRVLMMVMGGALGIIASLLVLPVMPYWEFSHGLAPILNALIRYSHELEAYLQQDVVAGRSMTDSLQKIEKVMRSRRNEYPEWVFEVGFNRGLRSSFRYVLVQLERITDAFFSLDYHARQPIDVELRKEIVPQLTVSLHKNAELLQIVRAFFANEPIAMDNENFTSDITNLHNALQGILPATIELLDISPDYVNLAAIARDVIDIRELLLQLLSGLPVDNLAVTE